MRRLRRRIFAIAVAAVMVAVTVFTGQPNKDKCKVAEAAALTPVGVHGKLSVNGTQLVDQYGNNFQICGVSTHGINWDVGSSYVNKSAFQTLRDDWGVNCIRLAMYTADYNGYCTGSNQSSLKTLIDQGVSAATDLGMYVIIDWHILSDGNPNTYVSQAKTFFQYVASKYSSYNNVLYEICNEPNGGTTWSQIKTYANQVIPVIRKYDSDAIILVGTPNWSQDVDVAAASPLTGYSNIMYTMHFYADTHQASYRDKLNSAVSSGLPVFVSEFGVCDSSGGGSVNQGQTITWLNLLDSYGIGYCCWSLSNKNETASLLKSTTTKTSGWTTSDLSTAGLLIRTQYRNRSETYLATPALYTPANSANGVTVKWTKSTGADGYIIFRRVSGGSWVRVGIAAGQNTLSFEDTTAKGGTIYAYTVRAYNSVTVSGYNTTGKGIQCMSIPVLNTPVNTASGVYVSWGKVAGAKGYVIYRRNIGSGSWTRIGTLNGVSSTAFYDKTAVSGGAYAYTVRASYGLALSWFNTVGVGARYLSMPTPKAVSGSGYASVSWTKSSGALGYYVYRKTASGSWTRIATVSGASTLTYTDKAVKSGSTYYYTVRAYYGNYVSSFLTSGVAVKIK